MPIISAPFTTDLDMVNITIIVPALKEGVLCIVFCNSFYLGTNLSLHFELIVIVAYFIMATLVWC